MVKAQFAVDGQISRSRKISDAMKKKILKYTTSSSKYRNGIIYGLLMPQEVIKTSKMAKRCSFGADSKGFFVYTHRARGKSYASPSLIPRKEIIFIETTG